jgi:hypothetical protein
VDDVARENLMFFLTVANIVAGVVSTALATVALVVIFRKQPDEAHAKTTPTRQRATQYDSPTEELVPQRVRRSTLLGAGERRLVDDFWG